ncbi:MAG: TetR/AcrR family transcriptional regulator [Caulobacteraceae bacterium]
MFQPGDMAADLIASEDRGDRDTRRDALLDAAAGEFNARGVSRASISRIAAAKGLTRAAVYYYVRDRSDLVFQAYGRSCEVMARDLEAAEAAGGRATDQIEAFVRRALDPERAPTAVLGDLGYLRGAERADITAAHQANVDSLRGIVRMGVAMDELRPCDDEIIAQALIGMVAWIPLSAEWVEGMDAGHRARAIDALVDVLAHGEAADPKWTFVPPVAIGAFFPPAPDPFDREQVARAKLERLLRTASALFNRRGIDGASLDDVVRSLGATKGAFYHYLDNKTELVVRCQERANELYDAFALASDRLGRTSLEKATIGLYLLVQAQASGLSPLVQLVGHAAFPPAARRAMLRRNRAVQQRYQQFGELSRVDGAMRPIDFNAVSQLAAGVFEWLPKWFDPSDPRADQALAHELVNLFVHGLKARP